MLQKKYSTQRYKAHEEKKIMIILIFLCVFCGFLVSLCLKILLQNKRRFNCKTSFTGYLGIPFRRF